MDVLEATELLRREAALVVNRSRPELEVLRTERLQKVVWGASGVQYQVEISALPDGAHPDEDVTLLLSIDDGGWRGFLPLSGSLHLHKDGTWSDLEMTTPRKPLIQRLLDWRTPAE